mgnify:CR=1 FL=1
MRAWSWVVNQLTCFRHHRWQLEPPPMGRGPNWIENDELDEVLKVRRRVSW